MSSNKIHNTSQLPVAISPLVQAAPQVSESDFFSIFDQIQAPTPVETPKPQRKFSQVTPEKRVQEKREVERPEKYEQKQAEPEDRDSGLKTKEESRPQKQEDRKEKEKPLASERAKAKAKPRKPEAKEKTEKSPDDAKEATKAQTDDSAEEKNSQVEEAALEENQAAAVVNTVQTVETSLESEELTVQLEDVQASSQTTESTENIDLENTEDSTEVQDEALAVANPVELEVGKVASEEPIEVSETLLDDILSNPEAIASSPELREKTAQLLERLEALLSQEEVEIPQEAGVDREDTLQAIGSLQTYVQSPKTENLQKIDLDLLKKVLPLLQEQIQKSIQAYEESIQASVEDGIELKGFEAIDPQETSTKENSTEQETIEVEIEAESLEVDFDESNEEVPENKEKKVQARSEKAVQVKEPQVEQQDSKEDKVRQSIARLAKNIDEKMPKEEKRVETVTVQDHVKTQGKESAKKQGQTGQDQAFKDQFLQEQTERKGPLNKLNSEGQKFLDLVKAAKPTSEAKTQTIGSDTNQEKRILSQKLVRKPAFRGSSRVILKQVIEQARQIRMPRINTIRMILKPEHLGELKLEVQKMTEGLKVKFEAESSLVKEIIERNIPALKESLKEQGLQVNKVEVDVKGDQGQNLQKEDSQHQQEQEGQQSRRRGGSSFSLDMAEESNEESGFLSHEDGSLGLVNEYA